LFQIEYLQVATLEVVIPPEISDKHSTKDVSVAEGGSAKFICSATGHPTPTIEWQKKPNKTQEKALIRLLDPNGKDIFRTHVNGEVLEIGKVTRQDMGKYLCIAKNNVPPAVSKNFKLTVNCKLCCCCCCFHLPSHNIVVLCSRTPD
jgi:neurotrimin